MPTITIHEWDQFLQTQPDAHLLQTSAWGELKRRFGWQVERVSNGESGAQILFRPLPLGFSFAYLPKGPLGRDWPRLWPEIDQLCRRKRSVILKVEPDLSEPFDDARRAWFAGFRPSDSIQPRRTILVSLAGDESHWLDQMKQKTRYNIRLAQRKGVQVRACDDLASFYQLMQATGARDGFGIHSLAYYQQAYDLFHASGGCELLMAEFEGKALAGLMVFAHGARAWYLYGASNDEERSRMPTYLLQWEAMRWAANRGCQVYDMVGVPDADEPDLEAGFSERSDGLWGVYRFKRGFGGQVVRSVGAWDRSYSPIAQRVYDWWTKRRHVSGEAGQ